MRLTNVALVAEQRPAALSIPLAALQPDGSVLVLNPDGTINENGGDFKGMLALNSRANGMVALLSLLIASVGVAQRANLEAAKACLVKIHPAVLGEAEGGDREAAGPQRVGRRPRLLAQGRRQDLEDTEEHDRPGGRGSERDLGPRAAVCQTWKGALTSGRNLLATGQVRR